MYAFWQSTSFLKTITPSFWTRSTSNDDSITIDTAEDSEVPPVDRDPAEEEDIVSSSNVTNPALSRETSERNGPDRGVAAQATTSNLINTAAAASLPGITTITGGVTSLGRFLTGPMRSKDATGQVVSPPNNPNPEAPPIIYVGSPNRPHHLIVYQVGYSTRYTNISRRHANLLFT